MKTTSIFQTFSLLGYQKIGEELVVRPPQNLRAFRVQIIVTNQLAGAGVVSCVISNVSGANELQCIQLSNNFKFDTNTAVPPGTDASTGSFDTINKIVLDRRGVGYINDTFYIRDTSGATGVGAICFIWEGEID